MVFTETWKIFLKGNSLNHQAFQGKLLVSGHPAFLYSNNCDLKAEIS